jgi:hypothetical protein
MSSLKAARERAKGSQDTDLKAIINDLYDELLSLKEVVIRLTNENAELRRKPEPEIKQVGAVHYYFLGEKGPYCQPCYDGRQKLAVLTPPEDFRGGIRRRCKVCDQVFYEKPKEDEAAFAIANKPHPLDWMG